MKRVHNFYAGPAALPLEVLQKAQSELLDFDNSGMSLMELSHRSKTYDAVHQEAKSLIREMLGVPDNYTLLFLQGGASSQFSMVPYNLLGEGQSADYIVTGAWSQKALKEAKKLGKANVACTTEADKKFSRIPTQSELNLDPNARYVHITTNNTIFCTQWSDMPDTGDVPIVADMSSDILHKPINWSKNIGIIYAGAQKNLGPSGVTLVIIRNDLLATCRTEGMTMMMYKTHADKDSLFNTGPTFAIYILKLSMEWVKANGGAEGMERRNAEKAKMIYEMIDSNPDFFKSSVEKESRSWMNIFFNLPTPELEAKMIKEAEAADFIGIKSHRSLPGIRVSAYNATSPESISAFVKFALEFAKANGEQTK